MIEKIRARAIQLEDQLGRLRIGCMGLSFKPDVDDCANLLLCSLPLNCLLLVLMYSLASPTLPITPPLSSVPLSTFHSRFVGLSVAHSVFKGVDLKYREVFDLCGVTQ